MMLLNHLTPNEKVSNNNNNNIIIIIIIVIDLIVNIHGVVKRSYT